MVTFILPKNSGLKEFAASAARELPELFVVEARAEDIPFWIEKFARAKRQAIGITGEDLYSEYLLKNYNSKLTVLKRIEWDDKSTLFGKPALCLLGPKDKVFSELPKKLRVCISLKYKILANRFLRGLEGEGYLFQTYFTNGSTELMAILGLADVIIDIVYTGASMKEANLQVYQKLMDSDMLLIGLPASRTLMGEGK